MKHSSRNDCCTEAKDPLTNASKNDAFRYWLTHTVLKGDPDSEVDRDTEGAAREALKNQRSRRIQLQAPA